MTQRLGHLNPKLSSVASEHFIFSCPRTRLIGNALPSFELSCLDFNSVIYANYFFSHAFSSACCSVALGKLLV